MIAVAITIALPVIVSGQELSDKQIIENTVDQFIESNNLEVPKETILKIIQCESHGNQNAVRRNYRYRKTIKEVTNDQGEKVQEIVWVKYLWSTDQGVFQINSYYHLERAQAMGLNIYTLAGNLDYGLRLLKSQGTKPWNWSRKCWDS